MQSSIMGWVRVKKVKRTSVTVAEPQEWAYRFLMDFPEGIMTPDGPRGPFRKGDLVSRDVLPPAVWGVLLRRGAVEPYKINPEWPGKRK